MADAVDPDGPIEVWLSQRNMAVTCRVVYENENAHELDVTALSLRGAEREMTGWFLAQDYKPVGRWQTEHEDQGESSRRRAGS